MEVIALGQQIVNGIVEFLASTKLGQFSIKKIDTLFWTFEQVGKYSVQEDCKAENRICMKHANMERPLSWPLFWIVLIYLHMFRIVISKILVKFNKKPIESKDIVNNFQKWRRLLRSIRFSGLQKMRQQEVDVKAEYSEANESYTTRLSKRKRYDDERADVLFMELMNHTFSESDDLDSTFEATYGSSMGHSSTSSDDEEYESSTKFVNKSKSEQSTEDAVPIESDTPEIKEWLPDSNISSKSDEVTFESTMCNLSATKTNTPVDSLEDSLDFDGNTETTKPDLNSHISEISENGKTTLHQYSDPTDSLIAQLVALNKGDNTWNHSQS